MIKLDMEDPGICGNCIFCRENSNTGASECILKLPNHYEVDIHSKDENCPIIAAAKGEWIFDKEFTEFGNPYGTYRCSVCGCHSSNKYSFCKDCGADMRRGGADMTDLPKTYDGHKLGDFIVGDSGISKITEVDGYAGYTAELVLPKETFIEAYNKYIKGGAE